MATGGTSPGAKTRALRLSLLAIAVALGLLPALLPREREEAARGPDEVLSVPETTEPAPEAEPPEPAPPEVPAPVPEGPEAEDPVPPAPLSPQPEAIARLYLVVDDVGNRREDLDPYLSLDIPITFAVLPQLPFSEESAVRISTRGQELILHLPMEAESGKYPGPGTIYVGDSHRSITETLRANLRSVPGAKGINNHMGSKATADRNTMNAALEFARREGLFFLDSRTTHNTVALEVAREKRVPAAERHVFLDNVREVEAIREALIQGVALAREQGYAVLIGHATSPELATVLREEASALEDAGIRFFHLSALLGTPHVGSGD
ncbi:MAG: divergent polysaccharide deacetylase family protein [Spirochaetota bacterium]